MSKKIPSKDEALEALDFIVSVLKEHEKDLDRLINELGDVTEKMGDPSELNAKVEKVEERMSTLQGEINNLLSYLSSHEGSLASHAHAAPDVQHVNGVPIKVCEEEESSATAPVVKEPCGPSLTFRCKQWQDFEDMASEAQAVSFMFREAEKTFQVDAVKGNQIITYSGDLPKVGPLLKAWLSKRLNVSEKRALEGILAVG
jgi:uncharacterized coiled-coil protein SlyX